MQQRFICWAAHVVSEFCDDSAKLLDFRENRSLHRYRWLPEIPLQDLPLEPLRQRREQQPALENGHELRGNPQCGDLANGLSSTVPVLKSFSALGSERKHFPEISVCTDTSSASSSSSSLPCRANQLGRPTGCSSLKGLESLLWRLARFHCCGSLYFTCRGGIHVWQAEGSVVVVVASVGSARVVVVVSPVPDVACLSWATDAAFECLRLRLQVPRRPTQPLHRFSSPDRGGALQHHARSPLPS